MVAREQLSSVLCDLGQRVGGFSGFRGFQQTHDRAGFRGVSGVSGKIQAKFQGFQASFRGFRQDSGVSMPYHEFADSGRIQGPPTLC